MSNNNNNNRILSGPISYQELKSITRLKITGIYKIENTVNHKVYIGQSVNVISRLKDHTKNETNEHLRRSFEKYGLDNFSFEVLKETYDLNYWEIFLIQIYHATDDRYGYNNDSGGASGDYWNCISYERAEEIRQKIREKRALQAPLDKETVERRTEKIKQFWNSEEGLLKKKELSEISKNMKHEKGSHWYNNGVINKQAFECPEGFVSGRLGDFSCSEETRQKKREFEKNLTLEQRRERSEKISKAHIGKPLSQSRKENIGRANKGRKYYNNGEIEVMQFECPPGFVPGRCPKAKDKIKQGMTKIV